MARLGPRWARSFKNESMDTTGSPIYICLYVCTGMYIYGYMHVQDEAKDAPNEGQDGHDKGEDDEDEAEEDQDQGQDGNVCVHVCVYICRYIQVCRYIYVSILI